MNLAPDFVTDSLIERLVNGDPGRAARSLADWADPLDAAILAACLLPWPGAELDRRAAIAASGRRSAEAAFWRAASAQLTIITAPTDETAEASGYLGRP